MPSLIERIDDLAAAQVKVRKAPPQKALLGGGIDSWLWSNIANGRNSNLRNDQSGYAMAYLLVPDVRTCVDIMAYSMAQVATRIIENETHDRANDKTLAQSDDVNPRHIFYHATRRHRRAHKIQFMMRLAYMYILFDEMYVWPIPNAKGGFKTDLSILNTLAVENIVDYSTGLISGYRYPRLPDFRINDLAYDHGFNPFDDLRGSSILQSAIDSINILRNLVRYLSDFFANNARPGLVASFKDTQSDSKNVDLLRKEIQRYLKGLGKQHTTFISPFPLDWLTLENADIKRQYALEDPITRQIYRAFGIPMAMAGDTQATAYKEAPAMFKTFISLRLKPHLQNIAQFITDAVLPLMPDTQHQRLEHDMSAFDIVTEDDKAKSEVVATELQNQLLTLDKAQEKAGLEVDEWSKDRIIIDGLPVKRDMVDAIIEQRFLLSTATAAGIPDSDVAAPPQAADKSLKVVEDERPAFAYIPLANNPDVLRIQRELKKQLTDERIEWEAAPTLHVSLAFAGIMDNEAIEKISTLIHLEAIELQPALDKPIAYFDTPDGKALHIAIQHNSPLDAIQANVYSAFETEGHDLSEFSLPKNWNPHITLAYAPSDIDLDNLDEDETFPSFVIHVDTVIIGRDDYDPVLILTAPDHIKHNAIDYALEHIGTWRGGWTVDKARQELADWQTILKTNHYKRDFKPEYTRGDIADSVMTAYADGMDIEATFDAAFDRLPLNGLEMLQAAFAGFIEALLSDDAEAATKSLQSIRLDFEGAFEDVLAGIRSGEIDNRRRAGNILRQIIRTFGARAYRQGLADGGVMDDPTDEEQAEITMLRNEQSAFVSSITQVLIREDGITDVQAAGKPEMWWNKSIVPFHQAGLLSANRNGLFEWVFGKTEHCSDCLRLNGQRHRLKHFFVKGWMPQAKKLACGGFKCKCILVLVIGKARGKF